MLRNQKTRFKEIALKREKEKKKKIFFFLLIFN
jgi:hypothetical protein